MLSWMYRRVSGVRKSSRDSATGCESYITAANRVLNPAGIMTPSASFRSSPSQGNTSICRTIVTIPVGAGNTQANQVNLSYNVAYITPLGALLDLIVGEAGLGSGITLAPPAVMRE